MRLGKHVRTMDKDKFGRDREKIVELKIIHQRVNLIDIDLYYLLKFLCIETKCNSKCYDCPLMNEKSFKNFMEEWGLTND